MQPNDNIDNIAKLRWGCRRGMLELDVLLANFLNEAYPSLAPADQRLFVELLDYADPELFSWLLGSAHPEDPGLKKIVKMIQDHARNRI